MSADLKHFMISGFRRDADEICILLGLNAASSGNPLTIDLIKTFQFNKET
jgi:hypothetical protein